MEGSMETVGRRWLLYNYKARLQAEVTDTMQVTVTSHKSCTWYDAAGSQEEEEAEIVVR
jgi:hypothetical protein